MTVDPERVVLGTIAVAAGEDLCFEPLRRKLASRLWPRQRERLEILPAQLGEALPFQAGVAVALGDRFFAEPSSRAGDEPGAS